MSYCNLYFKLLFIYFLILPNSCLIADSVGSAQLDTLSAPGGREVTKGKKMGRRSNQKKTGQTLL
jgi:hypothetical protein